MWEQVEWAAIWRLLGWGLCCVIIVLIGQFKSEWNCRKWQSLMFWYILTSIIILKNGEFANSNAAMAVYIITGAITIVFHVGDRLENIMIKKGDISLEAKVK